MARPASSEIGPNLARLRESAGMKQAELAVKLTLSAPSLSRVESGERPLTTEELQLLLSSIGTEEASNFFKYLERDWSELPVPPLNHPQQDLLWEAELACAELRNLLTSDIKASFQKRIEEYLDQIRETSKLILNRDHTIALIGSIGIGKSTAICRALGLELPSDEGLPHTVLEVGAGGITVCEVHIYNGPGYGLLVEPCSEEEIKSYVVDFSEYIWKSANGVLTTSDGDNESQGISKEIERAIRNLSGLIRRVVTVDGKKTRIDEAKNLATNYATPRDFAVEVLTKMALHKRDARNLWHENLSGKAPLAWMREMFLKINNGRHTDFSLPRRIELVIPTPLVSNTDLNLRFIDTKGIDRAAGRPDLEVHLQDPHTLALLCSKFNDAPATEARTLLTRANDAGQRDLGRNISLLVLPHPGEAMKMKDDATSEHVESVEEGYELKEDQVRTSLESTGISNLQVCFFNALEDPRDKLTQFVMKRLTEVRKAFCTELENTVLNVRQVIENQEKEQAQAVLKDVASQLIHWVNQNREGVNTKAQIQHSLLDELQRAHPSTIHASIRREGDWLHLNYGYQLGHGARALAFATLGQKTKAFAAIAENLRTNPNYSGAEALIAQCEQVLSSAFDILLRKMQLSGESLFNGEMKKDKAFWFDCESEWGQGSGYRDRVKKQNVSWFNDTAHQTINAEVQSLLGHAWKDVLARVEEMLEDV